jgi:hypothetical protein
MISSYFSNLPVRLYSMEVVFQILKILKIVCISTCYKACFVELFRSSSGEVYLPWRSSSRFSNCENCVGLYWTCPTNFTKHVLLISCYLGHLPVRSVFLIFKIVKIVLGPSGRVLQMLQSMFLLISSYLGHLPVRLSSMEVIFQILKFLK